MSHAFDPDSFGQLVVDAERLAAQTAEHEHSLSSLEKLLENDGGAVAAVIVEAGVALHGGASAVVTPNRLGDLLATVQELRLGAAEQKRTAESLRARLAGRLSTDGADAAPRPVVLIVDDSKDNREVTALLLETSGFDAITASNGLEGLIAAHFARPSVVIMDVAMPVLDGIQATRLLRASPVTQRINVIAHTARMLLDGDAPLGELFEEVLPKPASADAMISAVQRYATSNAA
jgi:two-component system, cell cycle response regulator DivK